MKKDISIKKLKVGWARATYFKHPLLEQTLLQFNKEPNLIISNYFFNIVNKDLTN